MSFCPVIEIFPTSITHFADSDGRIILDVDGSTSVSLSKVLRIQDDVYTIGSIQALSLSLPKTPKNLFYLKHLYAPNSDNPVGVYMESRINVGSESLVFDRIYAQDKSNVLEVQFKSSEDWIDKLKNLKLNDLQTVGEDGFLGFIDFTKDNIEDKWANNSMYNDGDDGYWFPLVDYGNWRSAEYHMAMVEDVRPFIHTLWLMRKCFAQIGWCLEFPFYETELGRRCIDYLLKSDYGDDESLKTRRKFRAKKTLPVNFNSGLLANWIELSDPGNSFNETTGYYSNVFEGKFILRVSHNGVPNIFEGTVTITFTVWKVTTLIGGGTASILGTFQVTPGSSPADHTFEIETSVTPNDSVYITVDSSDTNGFGESITPVPLNINWSNEVKSTYHSNGDVINLGFEIDKGITAWQYMLGNIHFCGGIILEYPHEKKVRILTPFNADIFGETIEGYFNDTFLKLTYQQVLKSSNSIRQDRLRFVRLAFAQSTDEYINRGISQDNEEIYSKTIDFGEPLIDTEENSNPLFEPTVIRAADTIVHLEDLNVGIYGTVYLPVMIDNDDGKISTNIKPRKIVAYGYDEQNDGDVRIVWEGVPQNLIPYAAQTSKTIFGTDIEFAGEVPEMKLIYGEDEGDLWSLCLSKYILQFRAARFLDLILNFNNVQYVNFNNRNIFEIEYDGHPITGRALALNDYRPCERIPVQIIFVPELITSECIDSTPAFVCDNNPSIIVTINGNCYTFSIGGTFVCGVVSIEWEYKNSLMDWTSLGESNTVEICDQDEQFIVRANITYDCEDCPNDIISKTIDPCFNTLRCRLTKFVNELGQTCVQYELLGEATGTYTYEVVVNGGVYVDEPVLDPFLLCGLEPDTTYIFTTVITFDNGCEELELTCSINTDDVDCDNSPILVCIQYGEDGCYIFEIEGELTGDVETFIVSWACDGDMGTWLPGDDPVCCTGTITASAVVFICGCPQVCTPEIECDQGSECMLVDAGTPIPYAVCN